MPSVSKSQQQVKCGTCLMGPSVLSKQVACHSGYNFSWWELVVHNFLSPGFLRRLFVTRMCYSSVATEESCTLMLAAPMLRAVARRRRGGDSCLVNLYLWLAFYPCDIIDVSRHFSEVSIIINTWAH